MLLSINCIIISIFRQDFSYFAFYENLGSTYLLCYQQITYHIQKTGCHIEHPVSSYDSSYDNTGFKASASTSFCAIASARSLPSVVKYVLIFGSVPEGLTMIVAPPSNV